MPRVVGIGASAGGLIALEQFLAGVPEASGLAYIVIQHLDPTHPALLCELLQRVTSMRVCEAGHSMRLHADQVYVIPPNSELTVKDHTIQVTRPSQRRGMRLPIDALFQSLARVHAERAIGVVLSGMGADGTKGLLAIKQQGGLTLAQTPGSAQFDSMPASAIAAGCVDIVAEPQLLPERICRRLSQSSDGGLSESAAASAAIAAAPLQAIIAMLRERSKRDLSWYKTSTLLRRIERRMSVRGLDTMRAYEEFLRDNPAELDLMFREVLIGVTAFFRDPEVWQQLRNVAIPQLLAQHADGSPVRAWVVGCSTGEEAYSLAMIFLEAIAAQAGGVTPTVRIFASDLSAEAIEFARKGRYPATIGGSVGAERLSRFFRTEGGDFIVKKPVREMVLFAHHDVILDPPFTRLDLLSCRNLLIYFKPALQRRLIPLFRYCLRPGGTLLLGESETIGASQSLFTALAAKARIYRCSGVNIEPGAVTFPVKFRSTSRRNAQEIVVPKPTTHNANVQALVDQIILQQFSPAAVLVNQRGDILYINGRTGRYLEPAAGKADWNIHAMARPGIRTRLAEALRAVTEEGKAVELRGLKVEDAPGPAVDVTVHAIHDVDGLSGKVLIVFRDIVGSPATAGRSRARATKVDPVLGEELQRSRDEIRALRHETRASKEELQAANEELQSTNEELQSANEELTTSKEEAQSMNEELQTLNNELRTKLDDLALAQSDMQNLLNSTHIATLFLDNDLNVRRFTEQATRIVHLRDVDIGRPLSELSSTLSFPELESNARETLKTLATSEKEVATTDGQWYCVRIMPYRTGANVIQGVVITFVNITAAKKLESRLRGA